VETRRRDAFDMLTELGRDGETRGGETYDIVIRDPPAFAKSRNDRAHGPRARGSLARLVAPGGLLFIALRSHHAPSATFPAAIAEGVRRARREARFVFSGRAGPDPSCAPAAAGERRPQGATAQSAPIDAPVGLPFRPIA
jgi:23S rRNA (cytosine1962-C5)-methyltransferase